VSSPQSNLRLYGDTTVAADALAAGMPVALGADWLPSGSTSLLAELKVARRTLPGKAWICRPRTWST
jgi:5-methylthioadenosine/S-adenosylhomocysteine deaminase